MNSSDLAVTVAFGSTLSTIRINSSIMFIGTSTDVTLTVCVQLCII